MKPYPIFLCDLASRRCVVVGGDHEAERKVLGLLDVDAQVVVISERVTPGIDELVLQGQVDRVRRDYRPGDLAGAFLVIVSERNPKRTAPIWEEAQRVGALINAMDDVPHCNFVAGSVIRRGPLVISISTSGTAPAVAVRMREDLESRYGTAMGDYLELLGQLRDGMLARYPEFDERRRIWYALADSDVLELIDRGRMEDARGRVEQLTGLSLPQSNHSLEEQPA